MYEERPFTNISFLNSPFVLAQVQAKSSEKRGSQRTTPSLETNQDLAKKVPSIERSLGLNPESRVRPQLPPRQFRLLSQTLVRLNTEHKA